MALIFTNQQVIEQIDSGWHWTVDTASNAPIADTITYGIPTTKNWFPSFYGEYSGWSALNTKQTTAVQLAVGLWD